LPFRSKGALDSAYLDWFFLNGTKSAPAAGLTAASVPFTVPSTLGSYEVRFFSNNTFTKLATSPTVTVADLPPVPGLRALQPATVTAGSPGLMLSVQGSGFRASSQVAVNGTMRATTFVSSSVLQTTFSATEVATAG